MSFLFDIASFSFHVCAVLLFSSDQKVFYKRRNFSAAFRFPTINHVLRFLLSFRPVIGLSCSFPMTRTLVSLSLSLPPCSFPSHLYFISSLSLCHAFSLFFFLPFLSLPFHPASFSISVCLMYVLAVKRIPSHKMTFQQQKPQYRKWLPPLLLTASTRQPFLVSKPLSILQLKRHLQLRHVALLSHPLLLLSLTFFCPTILSQKQRRCLPTI